MIYGLKKVKSGVPFGLILFSSGIYYSVAFLLFGIAFGFLTSSYFSILGGLLQTASAIKFFIDYKKS